MAWHYFVYYRVADPGDGSAGRRVDAALGDVTTRTGVPARRMRRADDASVWMEIYSPVSDRDALMPALRSAIAAHGLEQLLAPGERRHLECFVD